MSSIFIVKDASGKICACFSDHVKAQIYIDNLFDRYRNQLVFYIEEYFLDCWAGVITQLEVKRPNAWIQFGNDLRIALRKTT